MAKAKGKKGSSGPRGISPQVLKELKREIGKGDERRRESRALSGIPWSLRQRLGRKK